MSLRERVRDNFRDWTLGQVMAYCCGIRHFDDELPPTSAAEDLDDLEEYYLRGYADAMGDEAEGEEWFEKIEDWRIEYRWWEE